MAKRWILSNKIIKKFKLQPIEEFTEVLPVKGEDGNLYRLGDVLMVVLSFVDTMIGDE